MYIYCLSLKVHNIFYIISKIQLSFIYIFNTKLSTQQFLQLANNKLIIVFLIYIKINYKKKANKSSIVLFKKYHE
jgi:hypothetical protein